MNFGKIYKIVSDSTDKIYICSCGKKMKNKYKTRRYHIKSETHKLKIKETHLEMIKYNPKYEVSIKC
jgi:hypothetical protein